MNRGRDLAYMEMAYGLAEKARGRSSPNPLVGAVVVLGDTVVGCGYHEEAGKPHAEVMALCMAGRRARGAALYVTLEPCVHWGRTPPCVDGVLASGLARAVVSAYDANPVVRRKGVRRLRAAGLEVDVGLLEERNGRLNEAYIKYITRKIPFVTIKAAISLDGRIATRTGDSRWISAGGTRGYVHLLRGENDALMIGVGTLLRDDPLLSVRHPAWGDKPVVRVVLDSRLRFPLASRMLRTLDRGRVLVFAGPGAPAAKASALEKRGVEVVRMRRPPGGAGLEEVLSELGRREIASLLVEGGSRLATSFIERRLADKLVLTLSPKLIGGAGAPGFLEGEGAAKVRDALSLKSFRTFRLGDDLILEGYF
jgi:diaminohydroxyphosphoribosylaminopyrimidine deaminase/5-amino-6-(5-phosphoribosylamino)uracil reductase